MSANTIQANLSSQPTPTTARPVASVGQAPRVARDSLRLASALPAARPQAPAKGLPARQAPSFDQLLATQPGAVWNYQEASPITKAALVAYSRGQIGLSVRGLDLRGQTAKGVRTE